MIKLIYKNGSTKLVNENSKLYTNSTLGRPVDAIFEEPIYEHSIPKVTRWLFMHLQFHIHPEVDNIGITFKIVEDMYGDSSKD